MDVHTKEQRSYNMSQVKSKNTKPEKMMFSMLRKSHYKFKRHHSLAGKPDIVFLKEKLAVFIDGEFWHGKDFDSLRRTLTPFWINKIGSNLKRDRKNNRILRLKGWHVMHLWDKNVIRHPDASFRRIVRFLDKIQKSGSNPV
jgi:DNA mismatch endonuclease (patch repair protein)